MSELLRTFLIEIRQHPAFPELLKAVDCPHMPRYRPSKGDTLEGMGAKTVYQSGRKDQHESWLHLLTGEPPKGET